MRKLLAFVLFLGVAAPAFAADAPAAPSVAWQHTFTHSFEQQYPGQGVSYRYAAPVGWVDVYVYSMGRSWQNGIGDPNFATHFDSTIADVRGFAQKGMYSGLEIGPMQDVLVSDQAFRSVSFRYGLKGRQLNSGTFLTARNGMLLKYRISIFADAGLDFDAVARQFIEENLRDDPTTKAVPTQPPAGAPKSTT